MPLDFHLDRSVAKRTLDIAIAAPGIIALVPVATLIAAAIRLEGPGPVLFTQERLGRGRRPFRMLKFRTMRPDAEREAGPVWASARDPRATAVGRLLRRTHLDEIPQLLNVLRGEMSLVGPRPERRAFVERLAFAIPGYAERFAVLPGITGLGQIRSGYDDSIASARRKTRYDRLYVRRACALLDLRILAETISHLAGWPSLSRRAAPAPRARRRSAVPARSGVPALGPWFDLGVAPNQTGSWRNLEGCLDPTSTSRPGPAAADSPCHGAPPVGPRTPRTAAGDSLMGVVASQFESPGPQPPQRGPARVIATQNLPETTPARPRTRRGTHLSPAAFRLNAAVPRGSGRSEPR